MNALTDPQIREKYVECLDAHSETTKTPETPPRPCSTQATQNALQHQCDTITDLLKKCSEKTIPPKSTSYQRTKFLRDRKLHNLVASQKSKTGKALKSIRREIKNRQKLLINQHYARKAAEINDASNQRDVALEFKLAKEFSDVFKGARTNPISNEALATHFEMHFCNRDDIPVPPEIDPSSASNPEYDYLNVGGTIDVDESAPTEKEVTEVLSTFKNRRCMGIDGIWGEQLKYGAGSSGLVGLLVSLLTLIWATLLVPLSWTGSEFSCIFKNKGSNREAKNYRAISITATLSRLFSQIFLNRIRAAYNVILLRTQCGFRTGVGTDDAIWGISQCIKGPP